MRTTAKGLEYPNPFYWDINRNPYASIVNGLADCTCYVYGAIIEDGHRPIVKITDKCLNADTFHQHLINGWTYIPYDKSKLEKGDVIEWVKHCHVAVYIGNGNIAGSFYTGDHGKAYWGTDSKGKKKFDKRTIFKSLKELSDVMFSKYSYRTFHVCSIETESSWVKGDDKDGDPEYILKHPLYSVPEDKSRDQIFVSADDMNVRNDKNEVLKRAEKGFYNVLGWKDANGYRWYEVEKGKYIANVPERVTFIPKQDDVYVLLQQLESENAELKEKLNEIEKICLR